MVVTRTGSIMLGKKELSPPELLNELKALHQKRPNARVLIHGDRKSYHGNIVKVMDIAKTVGFKRLGVSIQKN